jgi:hypothetical protein
MGDKIGTDEKSSIVSHWAAETMMGALIQWLILVLIICLLYWVVAQFAPPQILKVVLVVCVVIIVLSLIFLFLPLAGVHLGALR